MKNKLNPGFVLIVVSIILSGCTNSKAIAQYPAPASVTYQTFYDDLAPYGTWIDYPGYSHVWHPNVVGDFRPYLTNGYWNYTNEGNMWMSDYSWGWAPFHYGRWVYDDMYGWLWIPGYEWSPAWVTWGLTDGFYAWAPLLPEVNVGMRFNHWKPAAFYWNVVGQNHIYDRNIFNEVERRENTAGYVNRINVIDNFNTTGRHKQYYSKGPDINDVHLRTGRIITPSSIHEVNSPQSNNQSGNDVKVYRPIVQHPQPRQFSRVDNAVVNPVRNDNDHVSTPRDQQMQNVSRLPVRIAPTGGFENRSSNFASNRQRGRK